jgi:hypothetical protein
MGSIRRARIPEVPALAAMIANAFSHHPILTWTFPGPRLEERVRLFFGVYVRVAERGWLWTIEGLDAVARWAPPGRDDVLAEIDGGAWGWGVRSFVAVWRKARTERVPVFLVTSGASTAGFFSRLGFGILVRDAAPGGGPELWLMRWDPETAPSSGGDA